jgi:drug/metabolite transporter (DMT)-like permease
MASSSDKSKSTIKALGFIVSGAVMVSFTSVFVEIAGTGPTATGFYRMLFGGAILLGISLWRGDAIWLGMKRLWVPLLCGLLFSLDLFFWHRSIMYVGPGLATLLANLQVFFVAIIAVFILKERLSGRLVAAIPIAITGLFFILSKGWGQKGGLVKLGVLFGIITALSYALYIIFLRMSQSDKTLRKLSLFTNMAWISLFSALLLGISVAIEPHTQFQIPDLKTWAALLGLGVMGQVLGWVLISKGLPAVAASVGALALLLQPALAFIWDILFFSRPTSTMEYAGAVIVLGAIYLGSTHKRK